VGSVRVPELMRVEAYASVFQLVSAVVGRLAPQHDRVDLIRAAFPPGSMTGAPKRAAMQLIERLEPTPRGLYSGAIGYFDVRGGMDLSVVIRTMMVSGDQVQLNVGGAIVADSDPAGEYDETIDKARALLAALSDVEPLHD
jgi:anthranilate/para-aminobenzoate synthase component I